MERSKTKGRILIELNLLISESTHPALAEKFESLHTAILKKYYNATDVCIDYHRSRITLAIVTDDKEYNPEGINTHLPILPANIFVANMEQFLKSCIEDTNRNIPFYAQLVKEYKNKKHTSMCA